MSRERHGGNVGGMDGIWCEYQYSSLTVGAPLALSVRDAVVSWE